MIGLKVWALAGAGMLAATALATPSRADTVLTIGNLLELTGPMSASGPAMSWVYSLLTSTGSRAACASSGRGVARRGCRFRRMSATPSSLT